MLRDLRKLLDFAEPDKRKEVEKKKFTKEGKGKILEEFTVMDYIKQRKPVRYEPIEFMYWRVVQNELIEDIAFHAYRRMASTIGTLFPITD